MKKLFVIAVLAIFTNTAFAATSIHAEVKGMVCAFCAKGINKTLRELDATQDVWVDLKNRMVVVELKDQKTMSLEAFTKLIKDAGYDVASVLLVAVFVGELAVFQPSLNVNRLSLFDVLASDFGQAVIERDAVPLRVFNHLAAVFVFAAARCGHAHVGHGLAAGQVAHFRVAAAVADEDDFVNGCHG